MAVNKIIFNGESVLDLTQDTATAQDVRQGKKFHLKSGASSIGTLIPGTDVSDTTATANDVVQGKYFYLQNGQRVEGNIAKRVGSNINFVIYYDNVTFSPGYYQQAINVKIDETQQKRFKPENIRDGVVLMGVTGNYVGQGIVIEGQTTNYRVNATTNVNKGEFVELINTDNTIRPTTMGNTSIGIAKESGAGGETIQIYTPNPAYNVDIHTENCNYSTIVNPMRDGTSQSITFTANDGYTLPDSVSITGATVSWNKDTGTLTLSNPTNNITGTIAGVQEQTQLITNPRNGATISSSYTYEFASGFTPTTVTLNSQSSSTSVTATIIESDTNQAAYSPDSTVKVSVNGNVTIYSYNDNYGGDYTYTGELLCTVTFSDGSQEATDTFTAQGSVYYYCFVKGTKISLADGTVKNVEDICYDDNLLVWDFDNARYASASPLWIKQPEKALYYYKLTFESGRVLKVVGSDGNAHRLFSLDDNAFVYSTQLVGKRVYTENGIDTLKACERIKEEVEFYNIITKYHMNLFAENVLTSCRYSNLYAIKDMRYIREERDTIPYSAYSVPREYYDGLRLGEQKIRVSDTNKYVSNLIRNKL